MKHLTNHELHLATLSAATDEKNATFRLLEFLVEVDSRRMYADQDCTSLWDYVNRKLGYSPAQTSERVTAARLMAKIPEAKTAVESGELNLTNAAKLGTFLRNEKPSTAEALELLNACIGKSTREVEKILLPLETAPRPEILKAVSEDTTRISFDADSEFMKLLERARELSGEAGFKVKNTFERTLREFVKRHEPKMKSAKESSAADSSSQSVENPSERVARAPEVKSNSKSSFSRFIAKPEKDLVRIRAGDQCEHRHMDPTLKLRIRCPARYGLQFDHIIPYALGGSNKAENLRLLCSAHNLAYARKTFGKKVPTSV